MTPIDLLNRLKAEGVGVSLNLNAEADSQPSAETVELLRTHRAALLKHLAAEFSGAVKLQTANHSPVRSLQLHGPILLNLLCWLTKYQELRIIYTDGLILNAQPEHVTKALGRHPWGVVYNPERYLLLSWGDVPTHELQGLCDLETDELIAPVG